MNLLLQLPLLSIFDPFVNLMGLIINYIYKFLLLFGITKVAICIIVFTVVIKLVMLPLTYKQQKFSKVSAQMNPELQALNEKYRGKRDNDSLMKMQAEQQAIYKKYGASPASGCLPMIVIMIILFSLYPVIYSIPSYVKDVQTYYDKISYVIEHDESIPESITVDKDGNVLTEKVEGSTTFNVSDAIYNFYTINGVYVRKAPSYKLGKTEYDNDNLIAIMAGFSPKAWKDFFDGNKIEDLNSKTNAIAWNVYAPYIKEALSKDYVDNSGKTVNPSKEKNSIIEINSFLGLNIFDKPKIKSITVLIPILAALLQYLQTQLTMALSQSNNNANKKKKKSDTPDPMDTMKTMNTVMPIFSGIITLSLPIGVGIYWITSSIISIIIQVAINAKLKDVDIQVFVDESAEKNKVSLEKAGVHSKNTGKMAQLAKQSTKTIETSATKNSKNSSSSKKEFKISEDKRHLKANNIAAIANLMSNDDNEEES